MFDFENIQSANTKSEHKNELLSSNFQVLFFGPIDEKKKDLIWGKSEEINEEAQITLK